MGPQEELSKFEHASKYRIPNETYEQYVDRISSVLSEDEIFKSGLQEMAILPAGRIQRAIGSPMEVTAFNCFVSGTIEDDSSDIMDKNKEAFLTMRMGGGIGYDFSTIRPNGSLIKSLQSGSSGPLAFMDIFDANCKTVRSAGGRRGAQMGVMRVDHPDIVEFVKSKSDLSRFRNFNLSVGVTDEFMTAVKNDGMFALKFNDEVYDVIKARVLWDLIMEMTWDWAEPGVLFIDRANDMNNLWYCEYLAATNPCGEQYLPPYGACLLGSMNLVRFITSDGKFDKAKYISHVKSFYRASDNIFENTDYPLEAQKKEAFDKRRMGLGITGMANAIEFITKSRYASDDYIQLQDEVFQTHTYSIYEESIENAKKFGSFPLFDRDKYLESKFIKTLPDHIQQGIYDHGIRNSHLTSIAPTGTISLTADNVSSSIEPVFSYEYDRQIINEDGVTKRTVTVSDYAYKYLDYKCTPAHELTVDEHIRVLTHAQKYIDSACSKTCNVGDDVSFSDFKNIYMNAYDQGAKGCTTFRAAGKLMGVLTQKDVDKDNKEEQSKSELGDCYIDENGQKNCGQL